MSSTYDPMAAAARRIVKRLFPYEATRLEVKRLAIARRPHLPLHADEVSCGGWCKDAVRDIVRDELRKVKR
jgi:hypothetical protein